MSLIIWMTLNHSLKVLKLWLLFHSCWETQIPSGQTDLQGVNFTNILQADFFAQKWCAQVLIQAVFVYFGLTGISKKKAAFKKLVKLTKGLSWRLGKVAGTSVGDFTSKSFSCHER